MVFWAIIFIIQGASLVGYTSAISGIPQNITVMFLNPTSVRVSWSTGQIEKVEKYDVTYKPTDARVVAMVAGNSEAVTLSNLRADTQYQLVVTAVRGGKKFRSRPIVFRTLEPPRTSLQQDSIITGASLSPPASPSAQQPQTYIQIRGVEVGIVILVLIVWVGAIALFFNRWGKIRMLLPYQPDYKQEQLKVPGTGVCTSANTAYNHNSSQHTCSQDHNDARVIRTHSAQFLSTKSRLPQVTTFITHNKIHSSQDAVLLHSEINAYQHLHWSNYHAESIDSDSGSVNWPNTNRPRVNSAIDVANFLSQEFLRRHGSTSRLCRKIRSADNLPLSTSNQQNSNTREDESIDGDREIFLKSNQEENEKYEEMRQNNFDNTKKDSLLLHSISIQNQSSRDLTFSISNDVTATIDGIGTTSEPSSSLPESSSIIRHFTNWRSKAMNHPFNESSSIEERCCKQSYELSEKLPCCSLSGSNVYPLLLQNHRLRYMDTSEDPQTKIFEISRKKVKSNVEIQQHFGLPILSISEPSPSDDNGGSNAYL